MHNHNMSRHFPFRYAWVILFAMSVLLMTASLSYLIFAHSFEPQANVTVQQLSTISPHLGNFVKELLRVFGLSWFTWGFLSAAVSVTAYRRGEMWAWYAFWVLPVYEIGDGLIDFAAGGTAWWVTVITTVVLIATLLMSPQCKTILQKQARANNVRVDSGA